MMDRMIQQALSGMDEEQAREVLNSIDDEQISMAIQWVIDETIVPQLYEIRNRADSTQSTEEVRQQYESLDPQTREELFYDTLDELVATLVTCREEPKAGFRELKTMIRDPYTVEALLLIFENDAHIDKEYTEQLKDFGVTHLHWVGAMVLPEMYEEREVEEVLNDMDLAPDDTAEGPGA